MQLLVLVLTAIALSACSSEPTPQPAPTTATAPTPTPSPAMTPNQPPKPLTLEQKAEKFRLQFYREVEQLGSGITTKYAVTTMQKWEETGQVEAGFENTCQESKDFASADAAASAAYDANLQTIPLDQLQVWYRAKFAAVKGLCS